MISKEHLKRHLLWLTEAWDGNGLSANSHRAITKEPPERIVNALVELVKEDKLRVTFCAGEAGTYVWPQPYGKLKPTVGYFENGEPIIKETLIKVKKYVLQQVKGHPNLAYCAGRASKRELEFVLNRCGLGSKFKSKRATSKKDCVLCKLIEQRRRNDEAAWDRRYDDD